MKTALGIVEVVGSARSVLAADIMLKISDVEYVSREHFAVGRVTTFVQGDVAAVTVAVEAVVKSPECDVYASCIIANPHAETKKLLMQSVEKNKRLHKE